MRISDRTLGRLVLTSALVTSASASAQPLGPAEEALNVEAAWASARLGGTSRTMTSRDYFEVSPSGRAGGFADDQQTPAPRYWEGDCVGWTYGRAAVVRCTEDDVLPDQPGARQEALALRVFVKEGVDWMAVLNHAVRRRPGGGHEPAAARTESPLSVSSYEPRTAAEAAVLGVQAALGKAATRRDRMAYEDHTAQEFVRIDTEGHLHHRGAVLQAVAAGQEPRGSLQDEMRVRVYPRLAVLSWRDVALTAEGRTGRAMRTTRAFARINGAWQQIAEISSVEADTAPAGRR